MTGESMGDKLRALRKQAIDSGEIVPGAAQMKIEYRQLEFIGGVAWDSPSTLDGLNHLGRDGWRLAGFLSESTRWSPDALYWAGLFMREVH